MNPINTVITVVIVFCCFSICSFIAVDGLNLYDRYVIPIKQEYKNEVPGLIHDSSASGSTIFYDYQISQGTLHRSVP